MLEILLKTNLKTNVQDPTSNVPLFLNRYSTLTFDFKYYIHIYVKKVWNFMILDIFHVSFENIIFSYSYFSLNYR